MSVAPILERPSLPVVEIDTAVTPSFHRRNIEAIEGYGPDTSGYVAKALDAFETAYAGLSDIHKAREAAWENPVLTDAARLLATADFAERHQSVITAKFDAAHDMLTKAIESNESMLSEPLKHKAERPGLANEVRQHCKGLTTAQRDAFFNERSKAKDYEVMEIILGAPGFLSGLSDEERAVRTRMYHELKSPDVAKRLKVMRSALDLIHRRGPLLWKEMAKAVGASPEKVKKLREAKSVAEQAFILRGDKSAA